MFFLLLAAAAPSVTAQPKCGFQSSVNVTFCGGLTGQPETQSIEACRARCCADPECGVWEWCPNDGGSENGCAHWAGARCHTGPAPATTCPWASHWVGETKAKLPPPPPGPPAPGPAPPPVPPGKPATRKQGFSGFLGPSFTCGDAHALGLADSWYYTWMENAAQYRTCPGHSQAAEFVPMINGIGELDPEGVSSHFQREWAAANAHFLLGYNEPDPGNGHNHPHRAAPADAAKDWVAVQKAAEMTGLTLVSPAVSTTGLDDHGVSPWFDQFFGNCSLVPGCNASQIKYIAFHDYTGDVSRILGRAEGLMQRYGKQVWITEFAINKWARMQGGVCDDCNITRPMQDKYMAEVLPALDKSDAVFRYVWYTARDKPVGDSNNGNLLVWNESTPTPTSTGEIYKSHALVTPGLGLSGIERGVRIRRPRH